MPAQYDLTTSLPHNQQCRNCTRIYANLNYHQVDNQRKNLPSAMAHPVVREHHIAPINNWPIVLEIFSSENDKTVDVYQLVKQEYLPQM